MSEKADKKRKKKRFDVGGAKKPKTEELPKINPLNGKGYSEKFYRILEGRKELPVWKRKEAFHDMLASNKTLVLEGETGSGKTTQVCAAISL